MIMRMYSCDILALIAVLRRSLHQTNMWILYLSCLCALATAGDFGITGFSEKSLTPNAKAYLVWTEHPSLTSFNLYRKASALDPYSEKPVNKKPIAMLTDCNAIKAIIPEGSEEWKALANAFQSTYSIKIMSKVKLYGVGKKSSLKFDPCLVDTISRGSTNWQRLQLLSGQYLRIAQVIGQAYVDDSVVSGKEYWYEIRGINGVHETVLAGNVHVLAGVDSPLPAPVNVQAIGGDAQVLVTWDSVATAMGYDLFRRTMPFGAWIKVNQGPVMVKMTTGVDGATLSHPVYGFIDNQRWDDTGMPETHTVDGLVVDGPANGSTYRYQVAARNSLQQVGIHSAETLSVTPRDVTPPGLPVDLKVEALGQTLKVSWSKVTKDALGHVELAGVKGYNVYRCNSQADTSGVKINAALILQPIGLAVEYIDNSPVIIPAFGEKDYYYRIRAIDQNSNTSVFSASVAGHVPDIYPPEPPKHVHAEGHQKFIRVYWNLNSEPDMESYLIYRSLCHLGLWIPPTQTEKSGVNCGPFVLLYEMTQKEAKDSLNLYGQVCYNDQTVPVGSPLCYAYLIKAKDKSQNLSGNWPYPNLAKEEVICQRLRDETPPAGPIISGLQAQDRAIRIEWIAAPCQDLGAFHVYRAEKETGPFVWAGGVTVEKPPAIAQNLIVPYKPPAACSCDSIPLITHDGMNAGSFLDKKVNPKIIYWYKVVSVDQNGNESALAEATPYSTFTYTATGPAQPVITSAPQKTTGRCGLQITWTPAYNSGQHKGFVVFRSRNENGLFHQISPMLQTSTFVDSTVNTSVAYWYQVQAFDLIGRPSKAATPVMGMY
jgi:hypothetical protein